MVCHQLKVNREGVLKLLRAYAIQSLDTQEAEMVRATLEFVEKHSDCAERSLAIGHLTGSSWIVDTAGSHVLLTHHAKLGKWLQLGGHADGDLDIAGVARREAMEESGLSEVRLLSPALFDVDCHRIPARPGEPAHWHYDSRFLFEADRHQPLITSRESKALAWVELNRIQELTTEESMLRMARKTHALRA